MIGRPSIKIDKTLYAEAARIASAAGYASVEELIEHLLRREIEKLGAPQDDAQLRERLKGLGYI